jgi:phosphatidate cytidylyltransferase
MVGAWAGGLWFTLFVLGVAAMAAIEIAAMQRSLPIGIAGPIAAGAALAFPISTALDDPHPGRLLLGLSAAGGLLGAASQTVWSAEDPGKGPSTSFSSVQGWALSLAGGVYVGSLLAPAIPLRALPNGLVWVAVILAATWACDSVAFAIGRRYGQHRLAPALSPGKSLEGTAAGFIAAATVGVLGAVITGLPLLRMLGLGLLVGLAAVLGDLAESALKRYLGAKDSGRLMPGHGGLLDRIDSLLLGCFLGYFYVMMTGGAG